MPGSDLVVGPDGRARCGWCVGDDAYIAYHDLEWGRPVHGDQALFERLSLEGFQSGLSWLTILRKRESFRTAFENFDPAAVAEFGADDVERLMNDAAIVRNRLKIEATIANAQCLVDWQASQGIDRLEELLWSYSGQARSARRRLSDVPGATPASRELSKSLKSHGFRFVGPTTAYAAMQACGFVDDHLDECHVREP